MDTTQIKQYLSEKKVLFVTNTRCEPGTMFMSSLMTYADSVPVHNFKIVYGEKDSRPFYGISVFNQLTSYALMHPTYKNFDYIVYIDEDCFVVDMNALMYEIVRFIENGEYCMAGPMDGGMVCHRNHSHLMFNTYVSFWNLKMLREKHTTINMLSEFITQYGTNDGNIRFMNYLQSERPELLKKMQNDAAKMLEKGRQFRMKHFAWNDTANTYASPYAETVMNDKNNPVEPNQTPYSYIDDETGHFEPYYLTEQAWIYATRATPMYLFHADLHDKDENDASTDNSGLSSALYSQDGKLAVVHSWFSRVYTKWPQDSIQQYHTERINRLIFKYGFI